MTPKMELYPQPTRKGGGGSQEKSNSDRSGFSGSIHKSEIHSTFYPNLF